jgi:hypothetical protein
MVALQGKNGPTAETIRGTCQSARS